MLSCYRLLFFYYSSLFVTDYCFSKNIIGVLRILSLLLILIFMCCNAAFWYSEYYNVIILLSDLKNVGHISVQILE